MDNGLQAVALVRRIVIVKLLHCLYTYIYIRLNAFVRHWVSLIRLTGNALGLHAWDGF